MAGMDPFAQPSSPPPYKPRPRYAVTLRRLILWSALLAVAGLLRLAWGWKAEREWRAAVERCRAEGLPLSVAEWPPGPPEREPNTVRLLDAADRMVRAPHPDDAPWLNDYIEYGGHGLRAERMEAAAWFVAENPDVYTALEGLRRASADWAGWVRASGLSRASEIVDAANGRNATNGFDAVRSVRIAAFDALHRSDQTALMECFRHMAAIDRVVDSGPMSPAGLLGNDLSELLAFIAPVLAVSPEGPNPSARPPAPRRVRPAGRRQVLALIAELLDERGLREGAVLRARLRLADAVEAGRRVLADDVSSTPDGPRWYVRLGYPQFLRTAAGRIDEARRDLAALSTHRPPTAGERVLLSAHAPYVRDVWDDPCNGWGFSGDPERRNLAEQIARRRGLAAGVAAALFRADRGRWPADWAELVPAYLPAPPADPFSADGGPLSLTVGSELLWIRSEEGCLFAAPVVPIRPVTPPAPADKAE
jgi:hypothetical protein